MNSSDRLKKARKTIKSLGLRKPGKYLHLVCSRCGKEESVHVNRPEIYTTEAIASWQCYPCSITFKKGGEEMEVKKVTPATPTVAKGLAKAAKAINAKVKSPGVAETWVRILSSHVGKKTEDKTIAAEMTKACPGHKVYTEGDVSRHRSIYNTGKFPSQRGVAPKVKLERYVA